MPGFSTKAALREKKFALMGRDPNQSSAFSRFTEGRLDLKSRLRNLTFHRKRSYERKQNWMGR